MADTNIGPAKNFNVGRYEIKLPQSSLLTAQTQAIDGVRILFENKPPSGTLQEILSGRQSELSKDPRKPFLRRYLWTTDTGAVLYVPHFSDLTYYDMEARRLLPSMTLIADTDGDQSKVALMETIVRRVLTNFVPDDHERATFKRFGLAAGSVHQEFGVEEEFRAEFTLPDTGIYLEVNSQVVAQPVKIDLYEREDDTVSAAREGGLVIKVLRKQRRTAVGQEGWEVVDTGVEHKQHQYDARFEAPGVANSAGQTYLIVHFYTDSRSGKANDQKQFLALWDAVLDSLKVAP